MLDRTHMPRETFGTSLDTAFAVSIHQCRILVCAFPNIALLITKGFKIASIFVSSYSTSVAQMLAKNHGISHREVPEAHQLRLHQTSVAGALGLPRDSQSTSQSFCCLQKASILVQKAREIRTGVSDIATWLYVLETLGKRPHRTASGHAAAYCPL